MLHNYSSSSCTETGASLAFARYEPDTYQTAYNESYDQNAYIGFKYGTPGSATYAAEHANTNPSTILTNLEEWYNLNNKFGDYEHLLADTIWCNDKSIETVYPYGNSLGYGTNNTGYSARGRIYADYKVSTEAAPTLICPEGSSGGKLSKFTVDDTTNGNGALDKKIGLLTADEIAFAGAIYGTGNYTYYLRKNAYGIWWSLSPDNFYGGNTVVWCVFSAGYLTMGNVHVANGLRPAVSLDSTTTITGGDGKLSTPYVISP